MNLFPFKVSVTNRKLFRERNRWRSGKQATGYGDLLTGLEGMVRGRQDTVQDEQRYELGLQDRESDIRKQDRDPIAETGIQGRDLANWSKDKTHREQILDLGLVT